MTRIIQPQYDKRTVVSVAKGNEIIDDLIARRDQTPSPKKGTELPTAGSPEPETAEEFRVKSMEDRFRIYYVNHGDNLFLVDISKKLLDEGDRHSQKEWLRLQRPSDSWKVPSVPIYNSIIFALYDHRNTPDEETRAAIEDLKGTLSLDLHLRRMMTNSSITFNYDNKYHDKVTHHFNFAPNPEEDSTSLTHQGKINNRYRPKHVINKIFGSNDLKKINHSYVWLAEKNPAIAVHNLPTRSSYQSTILLSTDPRNNLITIDLDLRENIEACARGVIMHSI